MNSMNLNRMNDTRWGAAGVNNTSGEIFSCYWAQNKINKSGLDEM